jgi:outer membrane protein
MGRGSRQVGVGLLVLLASLPARAGEDGFLVELADSLDLNEFALTGEYYTSQSLYAGVDNFQIVYPLLRTFGSSVHSDSILYIRDRYGGLRYITDDGWVFGVVGTVQTLGYGSEDSDVFSGMERRNWSLQAGAHVGKRFERIAFDLFATTDLLGEHDGEEYDLLVAWPFNFDTWELVPQVGFTYQTSNFVDHYFGVRITEAIPDRRPGYEPGAALTTSARLGYSYRINDRWFMTAAATIEFLPDEIKDSPLVERETAWSFSVGISYDAPAFTAVDDESVRRSGSALEVIAGGFYVRSRSKINYLVVPPISTPALEEQQLEETELVFPVDVIWQWGRLHRIDFRTFSLSRNSARQLTDPLTIGDTTFGPDEVVRTTLKTRVFRLGYGLSIFRDEQKELSLMGGIHVTDIDFQVLDSDDSARAATTPVLPVLGVRGRANFSDRFSLEVNIEAFALDFDKYNGELFDVSLSGRYRISDRWFAGLGYRYYRHKIRSADDPQFVEYLIDYQGPFAYLGVRF